MDRHAIDLGTIDRDLFAYMRMPTKDLGQSIRSGTSLNPNANRFVDLVPRPNNYCLLANSVVLFRHTVKPSSAVNM